MRRRLEMLLVLVAAGNCMCSEELQQVPGRLSGRFCAPGTGQPLAFAPVEIRTDGGEVAARTRTDSAGEFEADGLPAGDYHVQATGAGVTRARDAQVHSDEMTRFDDVTCQEGGTPPVGQTPAGSVHGRYCDRGAGSWGGGASVWLTTSADPSGILYPTAADATGEWTVAGVVPGVYDVHVSGAQSDQLIDDVVVQDGVVAETLVPAQCAAWVCTPGTAQLCFPAGSGAPGVGICTNGLATCAEDGSAYGACAGAVGPAVDVCGNGVDEDCNGRPDDTCACQPGAAQGCYSGPAGSAGRGACRAGQQTCASDGSGLSACSGEVLPAAEICGNDVDEDCNGTADDNCAIVEVQVNLDGDCLTASCPANAPYPVGCSITMAGGDERGCVASRPDRSLVYFQEGDQCGAGHVTGVLRCSVYAGADLDESNCPINKPVRYYPPDRSFCPAT